MRKKLKQPSFAAGVHRDEVYAGAELLGLELDEHIANVVAALQPIAARARAPHRRRRRLSAFVGARHDLAARAAKSCQARSHVRIGQRLRRPLTDAVTPGLASRPGMGRAPRVEPIGGIVHVTTRGVRQAADLRRRRRQAPVHRVSWRSRCTGCRWVNASRTA